MASKKASKTGLKEIRSTEEESNDPFATDFFSQISYDHDESDESNFEGEVNEDSGFAAEENRLWSAELPQITVAEVNQKLSFTQLPDELGARICKISSDNISQIILQNAATANCELISTLETDYSAEIERAIIEQAICLSFVVQPQQEVAALILDPSFAVGIIETSLSSNAAATERRQLSKTELSVIEFLSLNCLKDINAFFLEPLFRWRAVEQTDINLSLKRGLLSSIRIQLGDIFGIIKLLLPFDFLQSLSQSNNPLLGRRQSGENLARFAKVTSGVRLHVALGETTIDATELAVLEPGDVILVERPLVLWTNSGLSGATQIRVGDEISESLYGELSTSESLKFELREVNQRNINEPFRLIMSDNQTENQSLEQTANPLTGENSSEELNNGALALEKVTIKITVELASRRISLNDLANIHVGQVIELGTRATDPVELVADGRTVAIGELIDVEGALGVRLARVLL